MNFAMTCGVPQGSCPGPLLFVLYASKIFQIVDKHLPGIHRYADDSQLYLSFCPNVGVKQGVTLGRMESCIYDISNWKLNEKLKLNDDKTEYLIIGTQQLAKVTISSLHVGNPAVTPLSSARNLGSWFTVATQITRTCNSASYDLYNQRRIRKYLPKENTKTLVHAFISSRVDYSDSLLYGAPEYQINKLQRVQHLCARLICNDGKYRHITLLLMELRWLSFKLRTEFKIVLIVFKIFKDVAPSYLSFLITLQP